MGKRYEKTWNRGEGAGKYTYAMLSAAGVLGFFLLWQLAVESGLVSSRYITKPTELVGVFLRKMYDSAPDGSTLPSNILASLKVALSGLALAILIGVPLGWLMGWYGEIDAFMKPFFSAFVPCVINSYTGIRQTKSILINVAKTCGASNFTIFRKVGIPSSLPVTFAGIRVALGNAWSTLVAAEMLAANVGLGYMIQMGRTFARPDIIILGMVVIGAFGAFFAAMLDLMEKRFVKGGGNRG